MQRIRKPRRSLKTILILWFIFFSIAPIMFVTGFSINRYEEAIDHELSQRLIGNAREISVIFNDFKSGLEDRRNRYLKDPSFIYNLSTNETASLRPLALTWMKSELANSLTFFNRDGRMLASVFRDQNGESREFSPAPNAAIYLSDQNLNKLKAVKEYAFIEFTNNQKMSLVFFTRVIGGSGKTAGYLEQLIDLDEDFLAKIKQRMKLEVIFLKSSGAVTLASHPDFYIYKKDFFSSYIQPESNVFFDLNVRGAAHGFIIYPVKWGTTDLFMALGASKTEAKAVLKNVNYAFFSVVGGVILVVIITILLTSNVVLKPLSDLVQAIQNIQSSDQPVEIPIKSDTEIGLLTESFNEMSRNVIRARGDLRKKIKELESANDELKETQSKLVHTSKMVSLGQLVAGVAHELNNPIGFIYSNMAHLKTYADKLIKLADEAERNPEKIAQLKKDLDIEYIKTDLPKLISSCEDGARRTRDIVIGLRNFSRIEESSMQDLDLKESIENTLNLLAGEIKNRIQVHKDFGNVPKVFGFPNQINQVFMNILSNSVQAIQGSGNIWITTRLVTEANGKEFAQVSVQDSGSGMSAGTLEKIFDPFFTTKPVGQGTGLGLSISYGIIQSHGGDIVVKSQLGIGTEFIVRIPLNPSPKLRAKT